ncbi:hypothetical protein D1AOALGA4SA_12898 [Olavius algarvensis Delta 1 endosymbiont]|nr:hypothetical protein D1AOALGA4SA_12898 [Olavius algarvensis Delta 1 endosymbiont]
MNLRHWLKTKAVFRAYNTLFTVKKANLRWKGCTIYLRRFLFILNRPFRGQKHYSKPKMEAYF